MVVLLMMHRMGGCGNGDGGRTGGLYFFLGWRYFCGWVRCHVPMRMDRTAQARAGLRSSSAGEVTALSTVRDASILSSSCLDRGRAHFGSGAAMGARSAKVEPTSIDDRRWHDTSEFRTEMEVGDKGQTSDQTLDDPHP